MDKKTVAIIGSGFGGLSAAALLGRKGYRVVLFEKNSHLGGRASVYEQSGFRFDMGPSWYLMPDIFERFFGLLGTTTEKLFKLTRLDPAYRIVYGKNDHLDIFADLDKNLMLFERLEPGSAQKLREYLERARYQYDVAKNQFLYRTYTSLTDFLHARLLMEGRRLHVFENLDTYVKRFFKNEQLRKIMEYSMVFLGGAPSNTPALYSLMSHIDFDLGVWYPEGGMGTVVTAMANLCKENGVEIRTNEPVTRIETVNGLATHIVTPQGTYPVDCVVANADYHHTETALLKNTDQSYPEKYWKKRTIAPSAFMLYLGYDRKIPGLEHHTLLFDHDWTEHFNAIFKKPSWPEHPSLYVACTSKTDPTVAPTGGETIVVLVPVAAGLDDSDDVRRAYRNKIVNHLSETFGTSFENPVVERIVSQRDFKTLFNAYRGTALGLSHTLLQTAMFRPQYHSKKVSNLFYSGQYTHPGIGMPMCLISGELAADEIAKRYD